MYHVIEVDLTILEALEVTNRGVQSFSVAFSFLTPMISFHVYITFINLYIYIIRKGHNLYSSRKQSTANPTKKSALEASAFVLMK